MSQKTNLCPMTVASLIRGSVEIAGGRFKTLRFQFRRLFFFVVRRLAENRQASMLVFCRFSYWQPVCLPQFSYVEDRVPELCTGYSDICIPSIGQASVEPQSHSLKRSTLGPPHGGGVAVSDRQELASAKRDGVDQN